MTSFDNLSDPLAVRLADGLARLAVVARQLDWQAAGAAGLSPTQADILRFVAGRPAGVRLAAVAAHAGVRGPTASDAVSALERKHLLGRHQDLTDARAVLLKATAAGRAEAEHWPASFGRVVATLEPGGQEALFGLVTQMIRRLQQQGLIAPQRTCVSCRHFRENLAPGTPEPHFCALVGAAMADRHLRLDCSEHEAA